MQRRNFLATSLASTLGALLWPWKRSAEVKLPDWVCEKCGAKFGDRSPMSMTKWCDSDIVGWTPPDEQGNQWPIREKSGRTHCHCDRCRPEPGHQITSARWMDIDRDIYEAQLKAFRLSKMPAPIVRKKP